MHHPGRNDKRLVGFLQFALTPREPYRSRVHNKTCPGFLLGSFKTEYSCYAIHIVVQARLEALGTVVPQKTRHSAEINSAPHMFLVSREHV